MSGHDMKVPSCVEMTEANHVRVYIVTELCSGQLPLYVV